MRANRTQRQFDTINVEAVAFEPPTQLLRSRPLTSTALTSMSLPRLKRYNQQLNRFASLTEVRARRGARRFRSERITSGHHVLGAVARRSEVAAFAWVREGATDRRKCDPGAG